MSKRFIYPQEQGERKRAKLDITVSDHNFPFSQNNVGSAEDANRADSWGDENDDEILLLASQACEQVYGDHNLGTLPDYTMCMQPPSTSTQIGDPMPSTSKAVFSFKKPCSSAYKLSTKVKDKFERISSPLPGISSKINNNEEVLNISDDFIFNDKICKGQDSNYIYRQLLQLQEENAKLKSENGKLSEKCVTKEGEASILRTQLKNCQTSVDNARMEKVKVQEKAQIEWSEKLATATNQMNDLRTQLDFKNLEIISIKEKCKMLESTKVKLTQVTVAGNDITTSQRHHNNIHAPFEHSTKRTKSVSNAVQTEDKSHFIRLNTVHQLGHSSLNGILHLIMEPTMEHCPILDYNEKLKRENTVLNKCRIFNTIHRLPSTPAPNRSIHKKRLSMASIHNDLTSIAASPAPNIDNYFNILKFSKEVLSEVQCELEAVLQCMTTAFQKEMDQRYIDSTSHYQHIDDSDLLSGRVLYKDEQAILGRRVTATMLYVLEDSSSYEVIKHIRENSSQCLLEEIIHVIIKICQLLDETGCAVLYSGLLLASARLLGRAPGALKGALVGALRRAAVARPAPAAACGLLLAEPARLLCAGDQLGALHTDYEQGVLLFKRDSCALQVLLRQVEAALKCMQRQGRAQHAVPLARALVLLLGGEPGPPAPRCACRPLLAQVLVLALRTCAGAAGLAQRTSAGAAEIAQRASAGAAELAQQTSADAAHRGPAAVGGAAGACRAGVQRLQQAAARDAEFGSRLGHAEGQLQLLGDELRPAARDPLYRNMLSDIMSIFQTSPEDSPRSFHKQAWLRSFQTFSLQD